MLKKISIYLIGLLPLGLIAGPFVGELILFLIFLIFLFFLIKEKPFYLFQSKIFKIFFLFWAYIVFVSLFAVENLISLKSSFFYIRFGLYTLAIIYFLISYENHLKILYTIYKYTLLFLIIDSSYQIFTGKDFFGLSPSDQELRRISGPFGDKQVLGSFIQKILPVFIYFMIKNFNSLRKINLLDMVIVTLSIVLIFRSGDRAAFGLIILFSFLFFIIFKKLRKYFLIFGLLFFTISSLLLIQNETFKKRIFIDTIGQFKGKHYTQFLSKEESETNLNFMIFSFIHQTHYSTAFRMFLDKPFFGHGNKMFRYVCKKYQYKPKYIYKDSFGNDTSKGYGCSTHPHNTYMQALSEIGIIGFAVLISFFGYLLLKIINLFRNNNGLYPENALLIGIFVNLWPLIPTGSFFNNWLSMLYFIPVSYYLFEKKYKKRI